MSGSGDSPQIRVRVPVELRIKADALAKRRGTSVSTIAREALEKATAPERREVTVQRELHRALLAKLLESGVAPYRDIVQKNIERAQTHVRGQQAQEWLDQWSALVDGPASDLISVLLDDDEHSIDMRQVSPFAGVLTDTERLAALARARDHAKV